MLDSYKKTFALMALIMALSLIYVPVEMLHGRSDGYSMVFDMRSYQTVDVIRLILQVAVAGVCCFVVYLFRNTIDEIDSKQKGFEDDPD